MSREKNRPRKRTIKSKPVETMYPTTQGEVVTCPTCNGGKINMGKDGCPLCDGTKTIKAIK